MLVGAAAVALLGVLVAPSVHDRLTPGCQNGVPLRVVAAPPVAPAVVEAADRLERSTTRVRGRCVDVEVLSVQPSRVVDALRRRPGESPLNPDVWVPDFSVWVSLMRTDPAEVHRIPPQNVSVARSPVVIAMPRPDARRVGWPSRRLGWELLARAARGAGSSSLRVGLADPASSAVGLAGLVSVEHAVAGDDPTWDAQDRAAFLVALRRNLDAEAADPEGLLAESVSAFPALEQSVWRVNSRKPAVPLVAVYPADGTISADFPFVILSSTGSEPETRTAAEHLLDRLVSDRARARLSTYGLRTPAGEAGPFADPASGLRAEPPERQPAPDGETVAQTLRVWNVAGRDGRVLVVLDVSGSMGEVVPGTGSTRIELAREAAAEAVRLFDQSTELGLWEFSARMDGDRDYQELLPAGPLEQRLGGGTRLEAAVRTLGSLQPTPGAGTGLHDTALAAFREANAEYAPGVLNAVVLLTDGRNDDPGSISRDELVDQVRAGFDPHRPVRFVTIGFGSQADADVLAELADVTGGRSYVSRDPTDIRSVFLDALTGR